MIRKPKTERDWWGPIDGWYPGQIVGNRNIISSTEDINPGQECRKQNLIMGTGGMKSSSWRVILDFDKIDNNKHYVQEEGHRVGGCQVGSCLERSGSCGGKEVCCSTWESRRSDWSCCPPPTRGGRLINWRYWIFTRHNGECTIMKRGFQPSSPRD